METPSDPIYTNPIKNIPKLTFTVADFKFWGEFVW